jgi:hypothetical protein
MRRAAVLAVVLVMAFAGITLAKSSVAKVTGTYTYWFDSGTGRLVSVNAKDADPAKGTWSWTQLLAEGGIGMTLSGDVTCLSVDGQNAWVAGPATNGPVPTPSDHGAFLWLHDSGLPGGVGDMAITWISDPGLTTAQDMVTLCENKATSFTQADMDRMGVPYSPFMVGLAKLPITSGNVVIHSTR